MVWSCFVQKIRIIMIHESASQSLQFNLKMMLQYQKESFQIKGHLLYQRLYTGWILALDNKVTTASTV
ncbi:MAG: hypothetical protein WCC82_03565 [Nitrososphaeraceae archaeon]|jgi:hypothetical protein